ncbi:MAG: ribulokinase [Bacteroidales bacterium]|nr:ribulokinase [Bacteroidales bacterium]
MAKYTLGIDYGTDSVRTVIVNTENGEIVATAVSEYKRWKQGKYCVPAKNQFRQHPLDYIESLEESVKKALEAAPAGTAERVVALSVDTTGSTPVAVDANGTPLALLPEFSENPNAMFVLWKDHTAVAEADEINRLCKQWEIDYTKYEGGIYSSEWFWAKILHVLREDEKVRKAAYSWVEHCDWIPALLVGQTKPEKIFRSRCAAGHKAMWAEEWGGLPSEKFLTTLDPLLAGLRDRLYNQTYTVDVKVGNLSPEWANRLGLPATVAVGVGAFDAHLGAVGAEIKPYQLVKVIGTSTCDMITVPDPDVDQKTVRGICGQVNGSIIPGLIGLEAGQSAFGDVYAWFKKLIFEPAVAIIESSPLESSTKNMIIQQLDQQLIPHLTKLAEQVDPAESTVVALDWLNGRRTPDANQLLKGAIAGLSLGSSAGMVFRALIEATAFGAKTIVDRFISEGVKIESVSAIGGVAKKSPLVMQILADVLNMPIHVVESDQACALGSAMAAAVAGGVFQSLQQAQQSMGSGYETTYQPNPMQVEVYQKLYKKYSLLCQLLEPHYNNSEL